MTPTIKAKPKPVVELNPYDPVGIGVGSLRLTPFVETSTGYDSNPDRLSPSNVPAPTGSKLLRADAGFKLRSDWERDSFQADLRLGYVDYFDYEQASRPDGAGSFVGRYDVTRDTAIDVLGHFNLDTQRPGAPAISSGSPSVTVTNRPIIVSAGIAAGVTEKFNRLGTVAARRLRPHDIPGRLLFRRLDAQSREHGFQRLWNHRLGPPTRSRQT